MAMTGVSWVPLFFDVHPSMKWNSMVKGWSPVRTIPERSSVHISAEPDDDLSHSIPVAESKVPNGPGWWRKRSCHRKRWGLGTFWDHGNERFCQNQIRAGREYHLATIFIVFAALSTWVSVMVHFWMNGYEYSPNFVHYNCLVLTILTSRGDGMRGERSGYIWISGS